MSGLRYDPNQPARNHQNEKEKFERVTLCGINRGPHDYMPIEWGHEIKDQVNYKYVTVLMCRVCFCRADVAMLAKHFPKHSL